MKFEKAVVVVFALAIAGFLIGVGKYNQHYANTYHPVLSRHAV